jgi:hypothetical protein
VLCVGRCAFVQVRRLYCDKRLDSGRAARGELRVHCWVNGNEGLGRELYACVDCWWEYMLLLFLLPYLYFSTSL